MSNHLNPCPHCMTASYIRRSQQISRLTRELTLICKKPECGHTWIVYSQAVRTLSPSAMPDQSVNLPISKQLFE